MKIKYRSLGSKRIENISSWRNISIIFKGMWVDCLDMTVMHLMLVILENST
jgi:hypothetical protein